MKPAEFLSDHSEYLLKHVISMLALSAFLLLTGTKPGSWIIVLIVWILSIVINLSISFYQINSRLKELEAIMDGLDQKYLLHECIPKPKSHYERKLLSLAGRSGKAMIEAVSEARAGQKEYREYIEDWVHEIKAPITTAQLICTNNQSELSRKLMPQLAGIDEHVERALYYARAGSVEKDFIVRETLLSEIVHTAIAKHQSLLIQNGIHMETSDLETIVYTDGKWVSFMLGQLLSNAVRYRSKKPVIRIETQSVGIQVQLKITDNGIGIPSHELPRIFQRGFTGSNGRARSGSTGMGLYICKKLADFLQIQMTAKSVENEYSEISMLFPTKIILQKCKNSER